MQTPTYQSAFNDGSSLMPSPFILSKNTAYPEVEHAFSQILNELYKKDSRINELEKEIANLKQQIHFISKNNNTNINNSYGKHNVNMFDEIPLRSELMSTFKASNSRGASNKGVSLQNNSVNNSFLVSGSNCSSKDNTQWKNEVKKYLNDVKEKVEPELFREFIKYIKVMTSKNNNNNSRNNSNSKSNKKEIVNKVKELFGEKYIDLYHQFEVIVCLKKV
jgi:hypothetical protein